MTTRPLSDVWASELVGAMDLHEPQYLNEMIRSKGHQGLPYFQVLRSLGAETEVSGSEYFHFEEEDIHVAFKNRTEAIQNTAGADIPITIHADNIDAQNRFYPRRNQVVMLKNEVTAYIHAIDTSTPADPVLTLRLQDATDTFGTIAAGETLIIISNQWTEGSGQPDPAVSGTTKYSNEIQTVKETTEVTGDEMTNEARVRLVTKGKYKGYYAYKGWADMEHRHYMAIDGALQHGKRTTNPLAIDTFTNRKQKSTEGLIPYMRRVGNTYPYTATSFDVVGDFDSFDLLFRQNFVTSNQIFTALGARLYQEIENELKDYTTASTDYAVKASNAALFKGNEALAVSVNFKYFTKSGRTYLFNVWDAWSHPEMGAAPGFTFDRKGFLAPLGKKLVTSEGKKRKIPHLGYRYKKLGDVDQRMEFFKIGGVTPMRLIEFDVEKSYARSKIGAHYAAGSQMIFIDNQ